MDSVLLRDDYEQDAPIFFDGLSPLDDPMHAGTRNGRFIFIFGNIDLLRGDVNFEDVSFDIDIVDMFLSKRTRISGIGPLISFGVLSGFYALDDTTFVVMSHSQEAGDVLHQWMVCIDPDLKTARIGFCKNYSPGFIGDQDLQLSVGEKFVIAATHQDDAFLLPRNPLSSTALRNITSMLTQAMLRLCPLYTTGNPNDFFLHYPGFFITHNVVGFFIEQWGNDAISAIDMLTVAVVDLSNGSAYLQEVSSSSSSSPLSIATGLQPTRVTCNQANDKEVAVFGSRDGKVIFFGLLKTRLLEYTEIKEYRETPENAMLVAFEECIVVGDEVANDGVCRIVGKMKKKMATGNRVDRLRLIRHPLRVPSLTRLASVALQKRGGVHMKQLQQIADRID